MPDCYIGLDVGKTAHHACVVDQAGQVLLDRTVGNDEAAIAALLADAGPDTVLVVDQPASIGALPVAVARHAGIPIAYLPGLTMRRAADLYPGESKTDPRDAFVIADTARTHPRALRQIGPTDELTADLAVLVGYDDDLAADATRTSNRLRDALLSVSPAVERVLGPRINHPAVLDLLTAWPTPDKLRTAGRTRVARRLTKLAPRMGARLADDLFNALNAQTVTIPGTNAYQTVIPALAAKLATILDERANVARQVEDVLTDHPLAEVLTSIPGVGVRTAARILIEVGDASAFPTAGHLAAFAGLAPVTRRSGTSIRGETRSHRGHKALKSALFLSAFASLSDPDSRRYYDRKRAEGKRHNAAIVCLARRRVDLMYALLRDQRPYEQRPPKVTVAA